MHPTGVYLAEDNEEALEGAIETAVPEPGSAFLWTAEINGNECLNLCCSGAVESITGFPADRFNNPEAVIWPHGSWFLLIHPDDREAYHAKWARLIDYEEMHSEYRIVTAFGEVRRVISRATR